MLAVFASVPVAPGAIVPVRVKVAVPPTSRSTLAAMLPLPAAGQAEPGGGRAGPGGAGDGRGHRVGDRRGGDRGGPRVRRHDRVGDGLPGNGRGRAVRLRDRKVRGSARAARGEAPEARVERVAPARVGTARVRLAGGAGERVGPADGARRAAAVDRPPGDLVLRRGRRRRQRQQHDRERPGLHGRVLHCWQPALPHLTMRSVPPVLSPWLTIGSPSDADRDGGGDPDREPDRVVDDRGDVPGAAARVAASRDGERPAAAPVADDWATRLRRSRSTCTRRWERRSMS